MITPIATAATDAGRPARKIVRTATPTPLPTSSR